MSVGLAFALLAAAALFIALWQTWRSLRSVFGVAEADLDARVEAESRRMLLDQKQALLGNLQDLRFEREAGKISGRDFELAERALRSRAKRVLRLLDADVAPFREEAQALVRARLSADAHDPYREHPKASVAEHPREAPTCTGCGATNDLDARFCKQCAAPLTEAAADEATQAASADVPTSEASRVEGFATEMPTDEGDAASAARESAAEEPPSPEAPSGEPASEGERERNA